ncbi:MAG: HAD-IC family P-type ATPase, partial [Nanoarchaeota archaeon]|nr:HAD-IC family P-type ATPase [Nanoarchaeota archaeon]
MQTIDVNHWKNLKIKDALSELSTTENGLSSSEAQKRLSKYGYNEIPEKKQRPIIKFLKTFYGPIPFMLIAVIVISFFLSKDIDAYIVIGLLLFNSIAAFAEEYKADNTLELLKKKLSVSANVIRDGKWQTIAARELVPGDIIRIRMGSIVPADAKIIESNYLSVDQSALTGESLPITAREGDVIYSSSIIKGGEATALVISTGQNTFFGKTANLVSVARSKTHLESAIMRLIRYLIIIDVGLVAAVIIYALTINEGILTIIPFALLILLASVPVALPAAFTVAMAYGTERLSSKNILITKLESIEEASTMNVVCLDKTGTITKNQLAIEDPIPMTGKTAEEVIKYAAFASRKEDQDQIDLAVLEGVQKY